MSVRIMRRFFNFTTWLVLVAIIGPAIAQQVADNTQRTGDIEMVIVTGTAFNTDVAPAKASLDTTEPQTIINKSYIIDSVANTADYTTILAIAPSMTGQDINGPGLSDGNVKNTLRGLPDGDFVLSYDGVPFGDTNGPSHHSESYFPGVTIGSIIVDRGPGNAGTLGAATFGGSVAMFSEDLAHDSNFTGTLTYGSWYSQSLNGNYQSGDYQLASMNSRSLINLNYVGSSGYLTLQNTDRENVLFKQQVEVAPNWTLTAFANYNGLFQHVNDNNGETTGQILAYGKNFALQNTDPAVATYAAYNPEGKKTDLDYVRLQGNVGGISIDDTTYTYAYVNKTVSTTNIEQSTNDILLNKTEGLGTVVNGVPFPNDVPGYTKLNAYRVWGNILRLADDFDLGWLTGELRAGVWWEGSATQRQRKDFDLTQCMANNCNPWHTNQYSDSSLSAGTLGAAKATSAFLVDGYYEYREHSGWNQYEPFVELELHPLDGLTVTPGFKYIDWNRNISAPLEQKTVPVVPYYGGFTTTRSLPFVTANYKVEQNWSVYAEYAQGIYVPDISSFEQSTPLLGAPKPEATTNYQVGTVYYADNFTFDGDLYYIDVTNNISYEACPGQSSETCAVNTGTAEYKGIEGEATYAFTDDQFGGALNGLSAFVSGSDNYTRTSGTGGNSAGPTAFVIAGPLKNAPLWTEATGLVYKAGPLKISVIDKLVGQQYVGKASTNATLTPFYKIPAYNNMDLKTGMTFGNFELNMSINNLLQQRNLLAMTINDKAAVGSSVTDFAHRGTSLDQYYFAPQRSIQISLAAHF